jgi:glutamate/tyrosine decarboxylase-like PLP-dependent enzyme
MVALEKQLRDCLKDQQAVYTVVAVTGSTEEGSVDPVEDIVKLRETLQAEGMSFLIHVDAAWGGYFKTMVPQLGVPYKGPIDEQEYVGALRLRDHTETHLRAMAHVNSVTLDPHKTGYIPYPAGALCYRDERMRFLVTWSSPYISGAGLGDIGIYGIEGRYVLNIAPILKDAQTSR